MASCFCGSFPIHGHRFDITAGLRDRRDWPLAYLGEGSYSPLATVRARCATGTASNTFTRRISATDAENTPELFAAPDIREFSWKPMISGVTSTCRSVATPVASQW